MIRPALLFPAFSLLAAMACLAMPRSAGAQSGGEMAGEADAGQGAKATVELIVPVTSVSPGQKIAVGIKFTMSPQWHIYWKNPGDSGLAPEFRWTLPGGGAARMMRGSEWSATEAQFPVPVRWEDAAGLVGYGYTGTVIFPAEVTVPASTTPGQTVELGVIVDYMICKEICLTETASAKVELTVAAGSAEGEEQSESAEALDEARQRLPQPRRSGQDARVEAQDDGTLIVETAVPAGAKNVGFFPVPPDGMVIEDVELKTEGGKATARFRARTLGGQEVTASQFEVVFGYDTNQGRRGVSIMVPLKAPGAQDRPAEAQ